MGPSRVPLWKPLSPQDAPKTASRAPKTSKSAQEASNTAPRAPKRPPIPPPRAPKRPPRLQEASKTAPRAPRTPPRPPKTPQRLPQERPSCCPAAFQVANPNVRPSHDASYKVCGGTRYASYNVAVCVRSLEERSGPLDEGLEVESLLFWGGRSGSITFSEIRRLIRPRWVGRADRLPDPSCFTTR